MKTKLFRLKFEGALASGIRALDAARTTSVGAAALFAGILPGPAAAGPAFELVGSYATGLTGQTSAEVVAVKGDKMYVSNAANASVDIVDISDPKQPVRLKRLDLSAYGSEVTSVAVGNGLVAAAVESGTEPGKVVFFSPGGSNLRAVEVGAGPDMVTFTPDGKRVLVANEGEPSGYGEGHVDPEGSASVL
jgi:DNA-binding beta-propeller fold protein YncE